MQRVGPTGAASVEVAQPHARHSPAGLTKVLGRGDVDDVSPVVDAAVLRNLWLH